MTKKKDSLADELAAFGYLINSTCRGDRDGDTLALFPNSDVEDMSRGARFIPYEVTMARRSGKIVKFVNECGPNCWYWELPDRSRIYHFSRDVYYQIGYENHRLDTRDKNGNVYFKDGPGPCPHCGNIYTSGGKVEYKKGNKYKTEKFV